MAVMGGGDFQTQERLLKWWNEMFVQKHRCVAVTGGWTGSHTRKGPSTDLQTCTAWVFNVGGVSREASAHTLLPSKGSSFSREGRWEKTEKSVSVICGSRALTFCSRAWRTSSLSSKLNNELQQKVSPFCVLKEDFNRLIKGCRASPPP